MSNEKQYRALYNEKDLARARIEGMEEVVTTVKDCARALRRTGGGPLDDLDKGGVAALAILTELLDIALATERRKAADV